MTAPLDVPPELQQQLFAEAAHQCRLCRSETPKDALTVVPIVPHGRIGGFKPEHMIVLCDACRGRVERGETHPEELYRANRLAPILRFPGTWEPAKPVEDASADPERRVAEDPKRLAYLRYLARLYNTYKTEDLGRGKIRYGAVYRAYRAKLDCELEDTPVARFDEGARYLQRRIAMTHAARARRAEGEAAFVLFADFNPDDYRAL